MEPHAHNLQKKTHACSPNYYEMFWIMVFSFKSSAYLFSSSFTSSSLPSFSLFFYSFFFQSNSKPFFSLPLLPESILSPLFPTSLLPLSPLLSSPLSDSQIFTADSSTCTVWGRGHCLLFLHSAQLSIILPQPIGREQSVSVKGYQQIWALEVGNLWKKMWERESVSAMYVCVLEQGQHTMCYF